MTLHLTISILYTLGLGALVCEGLALLEAWRPASTSLGATPLPPAKLARALSMRLGMGLLLHALAVVAGLPLREVLLAGLILALVGLLLAGRRIRKQPWHRQVSYPALAWVALGLAVIALASAMLPMDVLWANDARSIWFFHGKLIYYAGGLRPDAGWGESALDFSHRNYPKLIPILAASEMFRFGYWNEFLPKLALAPLLACFVFALLAGPRGLASIGAACVTVMALLAVGALLHDGYADAYAALPAAGALMATLRWVRRGDRQDAEHAFVLLGLALATKEEGRLFTLALAAGLAPFLLSKRVRKVSARLLLAPGSLATLVLALLPQLLWTVRANAWGLRNDLRFDHAAMQRVATRVHSGALGNIVQHLLAPRSRWFDAATSALLGLLGATAAIKVASVVLTRRLQIVSVACLLTGLVYFIELCLVYLMTPHDLGWHLETSADRVMLIAFMCVLVFMGDALEDLESLKLPRRCK